MTKSEDHTLQRPLEHLLSRFESLLKSYSLDPPLSHNEQLNSRQ